MPFDKSLLACQLERSQSHGKFIFRVQKCTSSEIDIIIAFLSNILTVKRKKISRYA
jgi:hypothetical protein